MSVVMTFAGRDTGEFGIKIKTLRRLLPERREELEDIPGTPGQYDYSGSEPEDQAVAYQMGIIQVDCMVEAADLPQLRTRAREIAAWLSRTGRLYFSDEPDKYYIGRIYSPIVFEQLFKYGQWTVEFKVKPFAFGKAVNVPAIGKAPLTISVIYGGTAPTPARLVLRNIGNAPIRGPIRITHYVKTGGIE